MGMLCKLFGHKFVRVGEDKGLCSAHECTRCGHHSPAIDWDAIARPLGSTGIREGRTRATVKPCGPLMAESHRPPPPMPACKPPAEVVDNAALMCEIKALREEIKRMRADGRTFPTGGMVPADLRWINGNGPRPVPDTPKPPPPRSGV